MIQNLLYIRQFSNTNFLNEHLWYGNLGHFLIVLSLCTSLFSAISYFFSYYGKTEDSNHWINLGRKLFYVHAASILGVFVLLFFMMLFHLFEYNYVWRHTSLDLPVYYIISAFWEGQEGSFLLWIFWHSILGIILSRKAGSWEGLTMGMVALVQFALGTMVIGIVVLDYKIGANPFTLLRDELQIPIMSRPNYLEFIKDGNGLNLLLQNYWMVIHPPILFLGFASTLIPFAYAFAALLKRDFNGWIQEALPWALFSGGVLGLGIMMGGAWAYEALSFGGFWAWDPVENASLVPWITLVAGIHTMLIYKATKHSLKISFFLIIFQFLLILYSTFLTRSGILGDTSVHAFTDLGMTGQLVIFLALFGVPALVMIAYYWPRIEENKVEEEITSREFWMFIGTLIFLFSLIQITYTTSIPVWNTLFNLEKKIAPPVDPVDHFNKIQIWVGIILGWGMALIQFFRYRKSPVSEIFKSIAIILGIGFVLCIAIGLAIDIDPIQKYKIVIKNAYSFKFISSYWLLLWSAITAIICNVYYLFKVLKGNYKIGGASIAHIGFGLMMVGMLVSQYKQEAISMNLAGIDFGKEFGDKEKSSNILLVKNKVESMGEYDVTYKGYFEQNKSFFYTVFYQNKTNPSDTFSLFPEAKVIKEGENTRINANPSTKRYWNKDIFTHINSVPSYDDILGGFKQNIVAKNDTIYLSKHFAVVQDIFVQGSPNTDNIVKLKAQIALGEDKVLTDTLYPEYIVDMRNNTVLSLTDSSNSRQVLMKIDKVVAEKNKLAVGILERNAENDWIIMKAIVFPHINILWLGCLIMVAGFLIGMRDKRKKKVKN